MGATKRTDWWTWVQFAVLCFSIPINVVLWVRNERSQAALNYATAMEASWRAEADFRAETEIVDQALAPELEALLSGYAELSWESDRLLKLQDRWLNQVSASLGKAASRIRANSRTTENKLEAVSHLRADVTDLVSPAGRAGDRMRVIILTFQRIADKPSRAGGIHGLASQIVQTRLSKKLDEAKAFEESLADSSREAEGVLLGVLESHL